MLLRGSSSLLAAALVVGVALAARAAPPVSLRSAALAKAQPASLAVHAAGATHTNATFIRQGPSNGGGTICDCVCGDRQIWKDEIFNGDVVQEKEYECEQEICPKVNTPGLIAEGKCRYEEDITTLTEGTLCTCQCGDKTAWRNKAFHGDVVEEKEKECLEDICPKVQPIPGYRFTADCTYDEHLYQTNNQKRMQQGQRRR